MAGVAEHRGGGFGKVVEVEFKPSSIDPAQPLSCVVR